MLLLSLLLLFPFLFSLEVNWVVVVESTFDFVEGEVEIVIVGFWETSFGSTLGIETTVGLRRLISL